MLRSKSSPACVPMLESEVEDEEASAQVVLDGAVSIGRNFAIEVRPLATEFAMQCVRQAPGVTEIEFGDLVSAAQRDPEWVSLWAAEPGEVQQCLLDMLAPIELQLDQFRFERGADAAEAVRGRQVFG